MPKTLHALKRYRIILKILSRQGKHSSKDIYQACRNSGYNGSYRTIQKDLEDLRDDITIFGRDLEIFEDKKTKKWYSNNIPNEIFSSLEFESGEIDALLFYSKILNQYNNYPIFKEISKAMRKVLENSNISSQVQELFESESFIETEKHGKVNGIELIPDVLDAIHRHKIINIEYKKFEDCSTKEHIVKPILLKEEKQMWYILAINVKHNNLTTYALDRIVNITMTNNDFEPISFDSKEYFLYSFGITVSDENPIEVFISFSPKQAHYIKTLSIHPSQKVIVDVDNEFIISVVVKPSYEFYSKILSYGSDATIVSPPELRSRIKDIFSEAILNYK